MNAVRICYLLIGLLVFQVAAASYEAEHQREPATPIELQDADAGDHPLEMPDVDQLALDTAPDSDRSNVSVAEQDFCQQCCDCHCCGFAGPMGQSLQQLPFGAADFRGFVYFSVPSSYPSMVFRPPIARV